MSWREKFRFWKWRKANWRQAAVVLLVAAAIALLLLELASRGAAAIFNRAMTQQDMLRGEIRVERMIGHINGRVSFDNLSWTDPDGNQLLLVPHG